MIQRLLLAVLLLLSGMARAACPGAGEGPPEPAVALAVKLATLEVLQEDERRSVLSLGTIRNSAGSCFEDVVLEVRYFDASHTLSDTVVQPLYGLVVPAHGEVAIRVLGSAARSREAYVSQEARVLNAEARRPVEKAQPTLGSALLEVLIAWGPMMLLLGMFMVFMRRMRGKGSPQERSIALLQQQVEVSTAQVQALQRVADALESRVSKPVEP